MTLLPAQTKTARHHSDIKGRRPFDVLAIFSTIYPPDCRGTGLHRFVDFHFICVMCHASYCNLVFGTIWTILCTVIPLGIPVQVGPEGWENPLPSVCIHLHFMHFHHMYEQGGGRWSSPATERGVKTVYTLLFLIE